MPCRRSSIEWKRQQRRAAKWRTCRRGWRQFEAEPPNMLLLFVLLLSYPHASFLPAQLCMLFPPLILAWPCYAAAYHSCPMPQVVYSCTALNTPYVPLHVLLSCQMVIARRGITRAGIPAGKYEARYKRQGYSARENGFGAKGVMSSEGRREGVSGPG
jgi:hypothetical protein